MVTAVLQQTRTQLPVRVTQVIQAAVSQASLLTALLPPDLSCMSVHDAREAVYMPAAAANLA